MYFSVEQFGSLTFRSFIEPTCEKTINLNKLEGHPEDRFSNEGKQNKTKQKRWRSDSAVPNLSYLNAPCHCSYISQTCLLIMSTSQCTLPHAAALGSAVNYFGMYTVFTQNFGCQFNCRLSTGSCFNDFYHSEIRVSKQLVL